ncbi:MAG: hypothetical protein AAGB14_08420 [Verrucomicrobiota bacterium]
MTEKKIQRALFALYGDSSALMIPNYTPRHWWECDMYRVTKAGYGEEFEIKLSVSDFKADAKKEPDDWTKRIHREKRDGGLKHLSKHERLALSDRQAPRRFSFVMPADVAAKVEIPEWAGLMVMVDHAAYPRVEKKAPLLHKDKVDPRVIEHARSVFYYRYWNLRNGQKEAAS